MTSKSLTQIGTTEVLPAPAPAATETVLEQFDPNKTGQGLSFYERFSTEPAAVQALDTEADRVLPAIIGNSQDLISYGQDALTEVVATTRKVLQLTQDVKLPGDEDAALRDLKVQLDKTGGYDLSMAQNLEKYREMKEKLKKRFGGGKAKAYFAAFKADRQTLEELTDEMAGDFTKQAMHRALMANTTATLYEANQDSLLLLEERTAVLERVRMKVQERRAELPDIVPADDPRGDEIAALEMLERMLDMKITDYAARWFTGLALSPMLRAQHEQQIMMSLKLHTIATTGMEKVRLILAQYAMALDLQADADTVNAFETFDNDMTQKMFKQTRATVAAVARASTSSSMTTETISLMAQEVTGMLGDVQTAYAQARADQQAKMVAMKDASQVIEAAQSTSRNQIDPTKVNSVVAAGKKSRSITAG